MAEVISEAAAEHTGYVQIGAPRNCLRFGEPKTYRTSGFFPSIIRCYCWRSCATQYKSSLGLLYLPDITRRREKATVMGNRNRSYSRLVRSDIYTLRVAPSRRQL